MECGRRVSPAKGPDDKEIERMKKAGGMETGRSALWPAEKTLEEPAAILYNKETEEREVGRIARAISSGGV